MLTPRQEIATRLLSTLLNNGGTPSITSPIPECFVSSALRATDAILAEDAKTPYTTFAVKNLEPGNLVPLQPEPSTDARTAREIRDEAQRLIMRAMSNERGEVYTSLDMQVKDELTHSLTSTHKLVRGSNYVGLRIKGVHAGRTWRVNMMYWIPPSGVVDPYTVHEDSPDEGWTEQTVPIATLAVPAFSAHSAEVAEKLVSESIATRQPVKEVHRTWLLARLMMHPQRTKTRALFADPFKARHRVGTRVEGKLPDGTGVWTVDLFFAKESDGTFPFGGPRQPK